MEVRKAGRAVLMFMGLICFIAASTLNTLAGLGSRSGIFKQSTEDVTLKYRTPLSPATWSLFVWDFIYVWFFFMFLYFLAGLCRRGVYEWMYTTPAVLPYGFHAMMVLNMSLNITWLFLYHQEMLLPSFIISALMSLTDYLLLFFSCQGLKVYGAWLQKHSPADLWFLRVLVQNGVAVYAAWGSISTLLCLSVYLENRTATSKCDCAMVSLVVLLMELLVWFLLENFYLDEHVRYVLTVYPVTILWLAGSVTQSALPGNYIYDFSVVILGTACVMFVVRLALVSWRHRTKPLYSYPFTAPSPVEIALTQRGVYH
ncbi:uncharacterized protein LOC132452557 [Gadus macrocephalus]|uniref:uncharacterized protein LOC132452557 n=1 Tax=Gadus macrocephalus TaxID=80720 RepID=UPI0028CB173F|nr:uncharacterized protein LOC132452557 [Gadus macrocephalus]